MEEGRMKTLSWGKMNFLKTLNSSSADSAAQGPENLSRISRIFLVWAFKRSRSGIPIALNIDWSLITNNLQTMQRPSSPPLLACAERRFLKHRAITSRRPLPIECRTIDFQDVQSLSLDCQHAWCPYLSWAIFIKSPEQRESKSCLHSKDSRTQGFWDVLNEMAEAFQVSRPAFAHEYPTSGMPQTAASSTSVKTKHLMRCFGSNTFPCPLNKVVALTEKNENIIFEGTSITRAPRLVEQYSAIDEEPKLQGNQYWQYWHTVLGFSSTFLNRNQRPQSPVFECFCFSQFFHVLLFRDLMQDMSCGFRCIV